MNDSNSVSLRPQGLKKWVVNLTNESLSRDEESVLELGLNFAPAPTKLPFLHTVTGIELGASRLDQDEASVLRGKICGVIRKATLPQDNLRKDQRRELQNMEDVAILPADKGNAMVVMSLDDYDEKLTKMLSTGTYCRIDKDPTQTQETRVTRYLKRLEKEDEIPSQVYRRKWKQTPLALWIT